MYILTAIKTAISFNENEKPKSILKTRSTPFPIAPESPDAANSPSSEPVKPPEDEEFDAEEVDAMRRVAAAALEVAKRAKIEQLKEDLAASQKKLALTQNDLENANLGVKTYMQASDRAKCALENANKRTKATETELKEALLRIESLESKLRVADGQIEKLQRELGVIYEEKVEVEELPPGESVNDTANAGSEITS